VTEFKDFTKRLSSTVKEKGREVESQHYEWFKSQGIRLKRRYQPRVLKGVR
jgi:hypothetical protein